MIFTKNIGASHIETAFPLLLSTRKANLIKKRNDKKKCFQGELSSKTGKESRKGDIMHDVFQFQLFLQEE